MTTQSAACVMFWLAGLCLGVGATGQVYTFVVGTLLSVVAFRYNRRFNAR